MGLSDILRSKYNVDLPREIAQLEIGELQQILHNIDVCMNDASRSYYEEYNPFLSDAEFDELSNTRNSIINLLPSNTVTSSMGVGHPVDADVKTVLHKYPMLSLDDFVDPSKLQSILRKMENTLRRFQVSENDRNASEGNNGSSQEEGVLLFDMMAELKIDGVSLSLSYEKGVLVRAATRGNGYEGRDVTVNAMTIADVPHHLDNNSLHNIPDKMEIRGEVYMTIDNFRRASIDDAGEQRFVTARNLVAGSLQHLDSKEVRKRHLQFYAYDMYVYDCAGSDEGVAKTYNDLLGILSGWGLPVSSERRLCSSRKEMLDFYNEIQQKRSELAYEIDGVVYKVDNLRYRWEMGSNSRVPLWAVAHKFPASRGETVLRDIVLSIGRTGAVTPVGEFDPIIIAGVTISRASLHSEKYIKEKDIRVGDNIIVERAGDVIPYIACTVSSRSEKERETPSFVFPDRCPSCESRLCRSEDEVVLRCVAGWQCGAQSIKRLQHFCGKDAMDIAGLGDKKIEWLYEEGFVREPADIFTLEYRYKAGLVEDISTSQGWGKLSLEKLFAMIRARRTVPLERFIISLGIRHVGKEAAILLAKSYITWENMHTSFIELCNLSCDRSLGIAGISSITELSIKEYFLNSSQSCIMDKLIPEIDIIAYKGREEDVAFSGQKVLFTGSLKSMSRREAGQYASKLGFQAMKSLTSQVDLVVSGDKCAAHKVNKAHEIGIQVLNEQQWIALISKYFPDVSQV